MFTGSVARCISCPRVRAVHHVRPQSSAFAPSTIFSDENRKKTVAKFATLKTERPRQQPAMPARQAAVLVPLCVVDGKVSLLYTLRAANLKSHRGQISFPGGMKDKSDKSLEDTALRETQEELGIEQGDVDVWGRGTLIVSRGDTTVIPIIGQIKGELSPGELKINPGEVNEVFAVSLQDLCDPKKYGHTQFRGSHSLPVFISGRKKIWGLTAIITHLFLNTLLPRTVYQHRIRYIPSVLN